MDNEKFLKNLRDIFSVYNDESSEFYGSRENVSG
jgi:hypothetical protein